MYKFKIKRQDLLDKGSCMLWSNRVSINDANMFDMPVIMGFCWIHRPAWMTGWIDCPRFSRFQHMFISVGPHSV